MHTGKKILKVFGKVLVGISAFLLCIFIVLWVVLKVPRVQNYLVDKLTTFVSGKTHTKVSIEEINIGFPKSILIRGVFLEDLSHDTLISADEILINPDLTALLSKKVDISRVSLDNVYVNLDRGEDSTFNFQFLIDAFASGNNDPDTTVKKTKGSPWEFDVGTAQLDNCRFSFDDTLSGIHINSRVKNLEADIDGLDLQSKEIFVDDFSLKDAVVSVRRSLPLAEDTSETEGGGWNRINAGKLLLENVSFQYADSSGHMGVNTFIAHTELTDADVNLQVKTIMAGTLDIGQSRLALLLNKNKEETEVIDTTESYPWIVQLDHLEMDRNSVNIDFYGTPYEPKGIDFNHLALTDITADIKNIFNEALTMRASIDKLSVQDKSNLGIRSMEALFMMDSSFMQLSDLDLQTNHSRIGEEISLSYTSLASAMESGNMKVLLKDCTLSMEDVILLQPSLDTVPFIRKNNTRTILVDLRAEGTLDNLHIRKADIRTDSLTFVDFTGDIRHVRNPKRMYVDGRLNRLTTGRKDLERIFPAGILPTSVSIPDTLGLKGVFKGTMDTFLAEAELFSSTGNLALQADIKGLQGDMPDYEFKTSTDKFDLGTIIKDTALGIVSGEAEVKGKGFKPYTMDTEASVRISSIFFHQYNYKNIAATVTVRDSVVHALAEVNDSSLVFKGDAKVGFSKENEFCSAVLNLKGADLGKLHITKEAVRVSAVADIDMKGGKIKSLNGHADLRDIMIIKNNQEYMVDSLVCVSVNEPGKSNFNVNSSLLSANFEGNIDISSAASAITEYVNRYFRISDSTVKATEPVNFTFSIQINDSPVLYDVFLPGLNSYTPGPVMGSFDSEKSNFTLTTIIPYIDYKGTMVKNLQVKIDSDPKAIHYSAGWDSFVIGDYILTQTVLKGYASDNRISLDLDVVDESNVNKIHLRSAITQLKPHVYRFSIEPEGLILADQKWEVNESNYIEFGKDLLFVNDFVLKYKKQSLDIQSSSRERDADMFLKFNYFNLKSISQVVEQQDSLIRGRFQGVIELRDYMSGKMAFVSDLELLELYYKKSMIGDLHVKADNLTAGKYSVDAVLSGSGNDVKITGSYIPAGNNNLDFSVDIMKLNMSSVDAFSFGQLSGSRGKIKGSVKVSGNVKKPDINGELRFIDVYSKVTYLNQYLHLKNEKLKVDPHGIYFSSFTVRDSLDNVASINGTVKMKEFSDFSFKLDITTENFILFNTTAKHNKRFYGHLILDSRINVRGTPDLPVVDAKVVLGRRSMLTFVVPEEEVSADKGEGVVEFLNNSPYIHRIMRLEKERQTVSSFKGVDLSANLVVNRGSVLKILIDPLSGDSIIAMGEGNLNFSMDPSGNTNLTGSYELSGGSYKVSLENLIKKEFKIMRGSRITWHGDPLDATVDLTARYETRTTASDLMYDGGSSSLDSAALTTPATFYIYLMMKGELLKPEISFRLDMAVNDRGLANGAVYSRLLTLNGDQAEVNKQVFSLLLINSFVPTGSNIAGGSYVSGFARNSVSRIMSDQLNKLSSQYIKGVEVNFNLQSYNQYSTGGTTQGNTQLQVGVKKRLFNRRLSVQVGGNVNLEGKQQNNASNYIGDIILEYRLTKNGRYRLKGFRQNQYDAVANGVITQTGVGVVYNRDYNKMRELFSFMRKKKKKKKP